MGEAQYVTELGEVRPRFACGWVWRVVMLLRNLVKLKCVLSIDLMLRGWFRYGNPLSAMGIWESEKTFAFFTKRP